ncbi:LysR family transcriptional regulator [Streptomyces sp. NPDC051840]|uniref:LysR substrate-binding domain-containing protein n=1 Tax=Streptomyces sp. NPDC051840 TaxID=3154752 RepID=UPI003416C3F1
MELRDIEIFLVLAEELHFGRTAERLHVTPGRVSQSVGKAERTVGGRLFERTTRRVRLTPLGEQLRVDLADGYRRIQLGLRSAREAAAGTSGTLTLGTMGFMSRTVEGALTLFRSRCPDVRLRHREIHPPAPLDLLRAGEVDVALLWLPVEEADLTVGPVLRRSAVLLMTAADHPLAGRDPLGLEELGDCPMVRSATMPSYIAAAMSPYRTPSGRRIPDGPSARTWHELLSIVASGQAAAGVSDDTPCHYPWPDLAYTPIHDAAQVSWALVWRTDATDPLLRTFVETTAEWAASQPDDMGRKDPLRGAT